MTLKQLLIYSLLAFTTILGADIRAGYAISGTPFKIDFENRGSNSFSTYEFLVPTLWKAQITPSDADSDEMRQIRNEFPEVTNNFGPSILSITAEIFIMNPNIRGLIRLILSHDDFAGKYAAIFSALTGRQSTTVFTGRIINNAIYCWSNLITSQAFNLAKKLRTEISISRPKTCKQWLQRPLIRASGCIKFARIRLSDSLHEIIVKHFLNSASAQNIDLQQIREILRQETRAIEERINRLLSPRNMRRAYYMLKLTDLFVGCCCPFIQSPIYPNEIENRDV